MTTSSSETIALHIFSHRAHKMKAGEMELALLSWLSDKTFIKSVIHNPDAPPRVFL